MMELCRGALIDRIVFRCHRVNRGHLVDWSVDKMGDSSEKTPVLPCAFPVHGQFLFILRHFFFIYTSFHQLRDCSQRVDIHRE